MATVREELRSTQPARKASPWPRPVPAEPGREQTGDLAYPPRSGVTGVLPHRRAAARARRGDPGAAERDRGDRARGQHGRQHRSEDRRAGRAGGGGRVPRGQRGLSARAVAWPADQPARVRRAARRAQAGLGAGVARPVRCRDDHRLPLHPRWADRGDRGVRAARVLVAAVRHRGRERGRAVGAVRLLYRTARGEGVRGPAVGRAGAGGRARRGGQRERRGDPAAAFTPAWAAVPARQPRRSGTPIRA
jgi:hypothetical protein